MPDIEQIAIRGRALRVRRWVGGTVAAAIILVAFAVPLAALSGIGSHDDRSPSPATSPSRIKQARIDKHHPSFTYEPGWHVLTSGSDLKGWSSPVAWATNAPGFAAVDVRNAGAGDGTLDMAYEPSATLRSLTGNQILIYVDFSGVWWSRTGYPPRSLPLQLSEAQIHISWEGQPAHIAGYQISGTVNGRSVTAWVYFSSLHPTAFQLRCAQQALDHLVVPQG
jgi:hypothetical protein